jgi:hypothetical protein
LNVTLLLVALVVFAFVFGQLLQRLVSRHVSLSGAEYLLIGALIGPHVPPRLISADSLGQLAPIMNLLLGLVGFLVGLRARRSIRSVQGFVVGWGTWLVTFAAVAIASASLAAMLLPASGSLFEHQLWHEGDWVFEIYFARNHLMLGLAAGVVATVSSSGLLLSLGDALKLKSSTFMVLRSSAATSQLCAIVAMGAILALSRETPGLVLEGVGRWFWLGAALVLGLVCGVCFTLFMGNEEGRSTIFLATVGTVTFAAGTGAVLEVSPLLVNLISGLTVSFLSKHASVLRKELDRLQHPIFVLLLILAGAYWMPVTGASWLFPLVYLVVRFVSVRASAWLFANVFARETLANRMGTGLVVQGTLAVSVAVDYALSPSSHGAEVLTAGLIGILVFDTIGASGVRRLLIDAESTDLSLTITRASSSEKSKEAGL